MGNLINGAVRLIRAGAQVYERKWSFSAVFICVFLGSALLLGRFGLLPETSSAKAASLSPLAALSRPGAPIFPSVPIVPQLPVKIEIPALAMNATIANPTTTNIRVLDEELLKGAARYPTSAALGETGNVILFGHSSYLPIVGNPAYKTFNGIQKLVAGDAITVYAQDTAYTYEVKSVAKESANNNSAIPLSVAGKVLTLVTCNSFGAKEDRFVVTADFVESHSIST